MSKLIAIPKVGNIAFPDDMQDAEIAKVVEFHHNDAMMVGIVKFMAKDPVLRRMSHSEYHKQMAAITAMMEKFPRMARALDAGIGKV